jgi:CheY-like chemotaxis protein
MTELIRIVVVDDDETQLAFATAVLQGQGFEVHPFAEAVRALEYCVAEAPSLVISDVLMPEVGGFELHARYFERFPERATPFVFLSSLSDASSIARGLDEGADDYLQKPIDPQVLKAKVRAILRRRRRTAQSSFRGDLQAFPIPALLRFCEVQGLTGYVDVFVGNRLLSLRFKAGQVDDPSAAETLTELANVRAAAFVVHSTPIDFEQLAGQRPSQPPMAERPLGRLSSVRLHRKVFQVQTELVGDDPQFVVSIVTVDSRTVWKHGERVPADLTPAAIAAAIDQMHDQIEHKLDARMTEELLARAAPMAEARREQFAALFDEGFDRFRAQDYPGAVACWERAHAIDPSNGAIAVNLRIAREKSEASVAAGR